jgi:hypothetical protein
MVGTITLLIGCPPKRDTESASSGPPGVGAHVVRGKERLVAQNELRELAQLYQIFHTNLGGSRPDLEAFKAGLKDTPKLYQAVADGQYVLRPVASLSSNLVFAYEKDVDLNGNRLVAMADATVKLMPEPEFQAALKKS